MKVSYEIDGSILKKLEDLGLRLAVGLGEDGAGPVISRELAAIQREWFETEGRGSWPPLAPSTQAARARKGLGAAHPILRSTNRLFHSLADPRGRGAKDAFIKTSRYRFEQGTLVPYAVYHQTGTQNMPARPVIALGVRDKARLVAAYAAFVFGKRR